MTWQMWELTDPMKRAVKALNLTPYYERPDPLEELKRLRESLKTRKGKRISTKERDSILARAIFELEAARQQERPYLEIIAENSQQMKRMEYIINEMAQKIERLQNRGEI